MLKINKTISVYGSSRIETSGGGEETIVQMNASINDESKGSVSINTAVINTEQYFANREAVDKDIKEFNDYAYSLVEN
ncbi:MAG: hypothetical protein NC223_05500 [Butyrivibrio sp.]|nr:hypothetical protein [Butyrivibrio sp.]